MDLTIALILVMLLLAAFLGAFFAVLRRPPTIRAEIVLPAPNVSRQIAEPIPALTPIPEDILAYIDEESEEHARVSRRHRARNLFAESGDWGVVMRMLQREDNPA